MEKLKLDLACGKDDLRPVMQYVKVTKNKIVATDAHIMAIIDTSEVFNEDFIIGIPEDGMLIHRDDWKKMIQYEIPTWKTEGQVMKMVHSKKRSLLIEVEFEKDIAKYPNWEAIIPDGDFVELGQVGINFELAHKIQQALDIPSSKLSFYGDTKPIKVECVKDLRKGRLGILCPTYINVHE